MPSSTSSDRKESVKAGTLGHNSKSSKDKSPNQNYTGPLQSARWDGLLRHSTLKPKAAGWHEKTEIHTEQTLAITYKSARMRRLSLLFQSKQKDEASAGNLLGVNQSKSCERAIFSFSRGENNTTCLRRPSRALHCWRHPAPRLPSGGTPRCRAAPAGSRCRNWRRSPGRAPVSVSTPRATSRGALGHRGWRSAGTAPCGHARQHTTTTVKLSLLGVSVK